LIASAVALCSKDKAKRIEEAKDRADKLNEYFGVMKKRYDLELQVVRKMAFETMYGTTHFHIFEDQHGRAYVWFSSRETNCEVGDFVKIRGTVKDHKEYRGVNQTVLTRCAISEVREAA
jgi:hypothetical protein